MKTEENKRMEALAYIIADLKAENIEMTKRVHQLTDDYNDAVRQQHGLEARKDENYSKQTLDEMLKMRDHCDELERENGELEQRVHQLTDVYNEAVRQQHEVEARKDEDSSKQMLGEMMKMRDHCDELERKNGELEQLVHKLTDDYNAAVHQLGCKEARKDENSSNQMPEEMQQMFDRCSELELENEKLKRIAKEFHYFVEDKKLYMIKGDKCPYHTVNAMIGYAYCLECSSYLGVIEGLGVICKKRLADAKVSFPADGRPENNE